MITLQNDTDVSITHFDNVYSEDGKGHMIIKLSELYTRLEKPKVIGTNEKEKLNNGLILSGKLVGMRNNNNVKDKNILVYDVDDLPSDYDLFDEVSANYSGAFAIYSTYKHTEEAKRYRLLFPVNRNLTDLQYATLMDQIQTHLKIPGIDGSSYKSSQPFALPVIKYEDSPYDFRYRDGKVMELTDQHLKMLSHRTKRQVVDVGDRVIFKNNITTDEWQEYLKPMVQHEGRNNAMTKILGHLLAKNVHPLVAYRLLEAWNNNHIHPMDSKRFERTFVSIFERDAKNRGGEKIDNN